VDDLEVEEDMHSLDYRDLQSGDDGSIVFRHWEQVVHLNLERSDRIHLPFLVSVLCCFVPYCLPLAAPSNAAMLLPSPLRQSLVEGRDM
jgi:hypothetical protein